MEKYYKILGIKNNSSKSEIKKAYRKLSKKYHPDVNPSDEAKEKMSEINDAYEILSGKKKAPKDNKFSGGNPFSDGGPFSDFFGTRVRSLIVDVNLTLEEVFRGVNKEVTYTRRDSCNSCGGLGGSDPVTCPSCSGRGFTVIPGTSFMTHCNTCNGSGTILSKKCGSCGSTGYNNVSNTVNLKIPKGMYGGRLIMRGVGNDAVGSPKGDVVFQINLIKHPIFEVNGLDLHIKKEVNIYDLLLGTDLEVEVLDGIVKITINELCEPNKVFRLKGKGLSDDKGRVGSMYVNIIGKMPEKISEEQRELLNKLKTS